MAKNSDESPQIARLVTSLNDVQKKSIERESTQIERNEDSLT